VTLQATTTATLPFAHPYRADAGAGAQEMMQRDIGLLERLSSAQYYDFRSSVAPPPPPY